MEKIPEVQLTEKQKAVINAPIRGSTFLKGIFGTGKTCTGRERLVRLLSQTSDEKILVLAPQKTMLSSYRLKVSEKPELDFTRVTLTTMSSLVRKMTLLFWPLISKDAGFGRPYSPPRFLTIETSQYHMGLIVSPMLDQGSFSGITIDHHRLYSQLIDNLNKAALVGFSHEEIGDRLCASWIGDASKLNVYKDSQIAINRFRQYCLTNNLLDFSLQVELFRDKLWEFDLCKEYLLNMFQHLIYDNSEEDPPYVHNIVREWLKVLKSGLIIHDEQAGFRRFLGADPQSSLLLQKNTDTTFVFDHQFTSSSEIRCVNRAFVIGTNSKIKDLNFGGLRSAISFPEEIPQFFPQMIEDIVSRINQLVGEGTPPDQITILSPFVSDSLQLTLETALKAKSILSRTIRPSIPIKNNPFIRCLLVLSQAAHPEWGLVFSKERLSHALVSAIGGLDLIRASLIAEHAYFPEKEDSFLLPLWSLPKQLWERIGAQSCERYDLLVKWLSDCNPIEPLNIFLSRIFGEVLSQTGFGFHSDIRAGIATAVLIESFQKFRWSLDLSNDADYAKLTREFIRTIWDGVISAQYDSIQQQDESSRVLIAPATTFIISNQPVDYQFWLSVGSTSWYERLEQPLTHPYVLSRTWQPDRKWTADDELTLSVNSLNQIVSALLGRCRKKVFLGISRFNEAGMEENGLLLRKLQILYKSLYKSGSNV